MASTPALTRLLLHWPDQVQEGLNRLRDAGVRPLPELWQLALGVLRMWLRVLFRFDTVGASVDPPRSGWRATLFRWRPARFPFLVAYGAIAPLDHTGLSVPRERVIRHLLAAHHEADQFFYDLEILQSMPGALEELEQRALAVLEERSPGARFIKDLCCYQGYHERLLQGVRSFREHGLNLPPHRANDPDITLSAYLRWCAAQPRTPLESWRAWRAGRLHFGPTLAPP